MSGTRSDGNGFRLQSQPELNTIGTLLVLERRRPLFQAGTKAEDVYLIESGLAAIYRDLKHGQRQIIELLVAGDVCGLGARSEYSSSCDILAPSIVRRIRRQDLDASEHLRSTLIHCLKNRLDACHDHITLVARSAAEERVCAFLLRLRSLALSNGADDTSLHLPLTRTEIADYLGLTLETVVRTFKDLARRQILELDDRHNLRIVNLAALRERAWKVNQ